jgi:hypothetical protein
MDGKLLKRIREADGDQIDLISKVLQLHPGYGTQIGWSYYVGGLGDHGNWHLDILLNQRTIDLQHFLDQTAASDARADAESKRREKMTLQDTYNEMKARSGDFLSDELKSLLKVK